MAGLLFDGAKHKCSVCSVAYLAVITSGTVATCASDPPRVRGQMFHPFNIIALQMAALSDGQ